jgi:hypothetical protein
MSTPTAMPPPELSDELRKRIYLEEQIKKLRAPVFSKRNVLLGSLAAFAALLWFGYEFRDNITEHPIYILWVFLGIVAYIALILALQIPVRAFWRAKLERDLSTGLTLRSEELQEKLDENFFTNLVKINFKYIDKYYLQTQVQANKSFALTAAAACVSFLIIVAGILILFFDPSRIQPGYVATVSGILGEFIAAVFFYLYNRTITKMGEYHEKLVLTQNIGLALRITEALPLPEKTSAQVRLVEALCQDINQYLTGNVAKTPSKAAATPSVVSEK